MIREFDRSLIIKNSNIMKVEIIKAGIRDGQTGKELKVGQKVDFDETRAKSAIERGIAIEVKSTKKKSQQKKVEDSLEKK